MDEHIIIRIKEAHCKKQTFSLLVTIRDTDGSEEETNILLKDPYDDTTNDLLEWYFEEYISSPYDDIRTQAATSTIAEYGKNLFRQIFTENVLFRYKVALQNQGPEKLTIEIIGDSPEFQRVYWESLQDPGASNPLSAQGVIFIRKNVSVLKVKAMVQASPTINLLIVTARPNEEADVNYRTIQRPLIDLIEKTETPVRPHILRPGTYESLVKHLDGKSGYYHIIHFDLHGSLLDYDTYLECYKESYGLNKISRDEFKDGDRAFIFFESNEKNAAVPVDALDLANLLENKQIPICILNACQSAKQANSLNETSLGRALIQKGLQVIVAMRYSVSVSAAAIMMEKLYEQLYKQQPVERALVAARQELFRTKKRKAAYDYTIELEDWLLPVMYQNGRPSLVLRKFTPEEETSFLRERRIPDGAEQYLTYGFYGRDLDILKIEKNILLRSNILLLQGMGGAGKTTLLKYLSAWWLRTGFIQQSFYFGYDIRAYTLNEIIFQIAQKIYTGAEFSGFIGLEPDVQHDKIVKALKSNSYVLMLDNTESITGEKLAIPHTLPQVERDALKKFIMQLKGGKTAVIIGSRSNEEWLKPGTFEHNRYILQGLDYESATDFANSILQSIDVPAKEIIADPDFEILMELLAGYPLALKAILPNLKSKTPAEILDDIKKGIGKIDKGNIQQRTESILKCIEYAHSNLSEEAQLMLTCLAPFQSIVNMNPEFIIHYYKQLINPGTEAAFANKLNAVIDEGVQNGFMQEMYPGWSVKVMMLQPVFTYFLKNRLNADDASQYERLQAAFLSYYNLLSGTFYKGITDKDSQKTIFWRDLLKLEYYNFYNALSILLDRQESNMFIFSVLEEFLDRTRLHDKRIELVEMVYEKISNYDLDQVSDALLGDYPNILIRLASVYTQFKRFDEAIAVNTFLLDLYKTHPRLKGMATPKMIGIVNQDLGVTYMEMDTRETDEKMLLYSEEALKHYSEEEDFLKAHVYRNMGTVYHRLERNAEAREYMNKALVIYRKSNSTYDEGVVHQNLSLVAAFENDSATFRAESLLALDCYKKNKAWFEVGRIYLNLGADAYNEKDYDSAFRYFQEALKIFVQYDDKHTEAQVYQNLGALHHDQKKYADAKGYYKRALSIMVKFPEAITPLLEALKNVVDLANESPDAAFEKEIMQIICPVFGGCEAETLKEWAELLRE
jgi:tetratricopeptide (TPR) repeat protein